MELKLNLDEKKDEVLREDWYNDDFKEKLDIALNKNILSFSSVEDSKYTSENLNTIYNEYRNLEEKVKYDYADKCTVADCEKGKLYSIKSVDKANGTAKLNEYNGVTMSRQTICVSLDDIPKCIKSNMFLRKKNNKYVTDEVTTIELYKKMKIFFDDLNLKQKKYLETMRKEGAVYKIDYIEDDCESWYTTLINIETNEKFQEIDFPHDILHNVGNYVKYEDGRYIILSNTDRYKEKPYTYEFCEREQCYYTRFGKIACNIMEKDNNKLEKLFIKAKQTNNDKKDFFMDMKIIAQIFYSEVF